MTAPKTNLSVAYAAKIQPRSSNHYDLGARTSRPARVRFGAFELNPKSGELTSSKTHVVLQRQPLQVLLMLIDSRGEMVTRQEIQEKLWSSDVIVEFDHSINQIIRKLRRALGDSADEPEYIETVARRGYRLKAPVEWIETSAESLQTNRSSLEFAARPMVAATSQPPIAKACNGNVAPCLLDVSGYRRRACRERVLRTLVHPSDGTMALLQTSESEIIQRCRASASPAEKLDALRHILLLLTELADSARQ